MQTKQLKLFSAPVMRIPPSMAKRWFDQMRRIVNNAPQNKHLAPDLTPDQLAGKSVRS